MATFEFKLPDIGEGIVEGEIVKWLVKPGDAVAEDQALVEVMTDKATVTIPSPKKGVVKQCFGAEGQMAKVHHPLVTLEVDGAPAAKAPGTPHETPTATAAPAVLASHANGVHTAATRILATPVTRRMAREHQVDLAGVSGSGPQGRVTKADLVKHMEGSSRPATQPSPAPVVPPPAQLKHAPLSSVVGDTRIPLKGLRKRIAEKMVKSKTLMPHFTFVEEMDCTELMALRARINAQLKAAGEPSKLSFLPFICKALIAALRKYPALNSNFDEATQELVQKGTFNLGIAVATDEGLIVPVLKHAEQKSLRQISSEVEGLADAARARRSKPDDLSGGTFTITSLGQTGGLFATPIINHPEVAILGVHKMREKPVVKHGKIEVATMMYLSLSFDHRVIDGSVGAAFTYEFIRYLEHPELLMMEMT
jgi:pyruvate dehydrogenase E2 component (dihydrolipoamide acetyltransferase)